MAKKNGRNTKGRIVAAAWKLFYEQGYENTTVEDIVYESETSKGSFYHYFEGKDALMGSLSVLFDEKYEELRGRIDPRMDTVEVLIWLNQELFSMIDTSVPLELLSRLLSSQLVTHGEKHLLDRGRTYFKLLTQVVRTGQERGELSRAVTANEIVKAYAIRARAHVRLVPVRGGVRPQRLRRAHDAGVPRGLPHEERGFVLNHHRRSSNRK